MSVQTALWLIRHPEPAGGAGRCYGTLDLPLSETGKLQAQALARKLAAEPLAAVYTSPRERCRYAASLLAEACGCPSEVVDDLRELDHGEWEGRAYDEIAAADPELYRKWMTQPCEVRFPDGECLADVRQRVLPAAAALRARHRGEAIAAITHVGPLRIILADALGMPAEHMFRIGQSFGGANLIRYWGEIPQVEFLNREV